MLLVISLDGLHPDSYLRAPFLSGLLSRSAVADRVVPVYPTVTSANHATIITGVLPTQHGIQGNLAFQPDDPLREEWYFDYSSLRGPTLWDEAERQGKRLAVIRWPISRGARARWMVPELFRWEETLQAMEPSLAEELRIATGIQRADKHGELDEWATRIVEFLLSGRSREGRPDLLFTHLVHLDHVQHETGPNSAETRIVLGECDERIRRIVEACDPREDTVLIVGDHGFRDLRRRVHLNGAFAQKGWIQLDRHGQVVDWKVVAHQNCGQAAIRMHDPQDVASGFGMEVLSFLCENAGNAYRVIGRAELDELGALPEAFCAVECLPGFSPGDQLVGPLVTELLDLRGEHGYLPSDPAMQGSLIAHGAGIAPASLGTVRMVDLAPTIARLGGISFEAARLDGRPIPLPAPGLALAS